MANPLTLKLILAGAAKAVNELKPLDKQSRATAQGLKQSRDALKLLNGQMGQINGIRQLQQQLGQQSNALKVLRLNLETTTRTYGANSDAARKLRGEVTKATAAYEQQRGKLVQLRRAATESGIKNLSADQTRLKTDITATNTAIDQQKRRLQTLADTQTKRTAVGQKFTSARATAGHMAVAGASGLGVAYGVRRSVGEPLSQLRHYETTKARISALGLGQDVADRQVNFADRRHAYGVSRNESLGLILDATTAFADEKEAKMVMPTLEKMSFANKAMFGQETGADNERKFLDMLKVAELRGGLANEDAFKHQADMIQKVIVATGGRVDAEQWRQFIARGGIAAKGLSDEAMYFQLEPLVSEMGGPTVGTATMSAYQNLYQGRTTKRAAGNLESLGLIGDMSKVKHDKAGQVSYLNPGALKGADIFRKSQFDWLEQVLLPTLARQGITDEKQVQDVIGSIFSNRTAAGLFGQMYKQREQIHKNARLNAGAFGVGELNERALKTVSGHEVNTKARFDDAMLESGKALESTYIKLLTVTSSLLEKITSFAQENPKLAESLGVVAAAIGITTAGFGALTIGMAALLGPFAVVRYGLGLFGIKAAGALPLLGKLGSALRIVGTAVLWLGRALLMNPIGLTLTAIAGAAFLIYQYWGPIKGFFAGVWDSIAKGAGAAVDFIRGTLGQIFTFLGSLPARFMQAGADMMAGLVRGITSMLGAVGNAIKGVADSTIGWFKEKLGIHSPSRVFMDAGQFIGQGAAIGIDRSLPLLRTAALGLAGATAVAMPAMAASFDTRPPLSANTAQRAPVVVQGDTINISFNIPPGTDAQAIARAVSAELDRRDRAKRARAASSFSDYNHG